MVTQCGLAPCGAKTQPSEWTWAACSLHQMSHLLDFGPSACVTIRLSVKMCSLRVARWLLSLILMSNGTVWMLNLCCPVCFFLVQFQAVHQAFCNFLASRRFLFICFQAQGQSSLKPKALSVFSKTTALFHKQWVGKGRAGCPAHLRSVHTAP